MSSNTNRPDGDSISGPSKANALPWSEHLRTLLCGVKDPSCSLHVLAGHESTIVKDLYCDLVDAWKQNIVITAPVEYKVSFEGQPPSGSILFDHPDTSFYLLGSVTFPKPTGRNVNMLPFTMGNEESLPEDLRPYYDSLIANCPIAAGDHGEVMYLTVSEGLVDESATQRRSGLHVEAAGGIAGVEGEFLPATSIAWGGGADAPDSFHGGLYMACNMQDTCEVFDALVAKDQGIVNYHGGSEHLRPFIGPGKKLKANELVWLTDRTPHEALPQPKKGYRQFFRLVTSTISVWFEQHSTANPKVPVPVNVKIMTGDKFSKTASSSDSQASPANSTGNPKVPVPAIVKIITGDKFSKTDSSSDGEASPTKKAKREN